MENYKKKLIMRKRFSIFTLLISLILLAIQIMLLTQAIQNDTSGYNEGFLLGFQTGLIITVVVMSIIDIVNKTKVLKDEHKIKLSYNKEHDERMQLIQIKCGAPLMQFICFVLILVAIISGYFNFTVFYTLIGVVAFELIVSLFLRVYYEKHL